MSKAPLYLQIKQFIDDKITSGHWPVGYQITTELELTEQFKVSRMTVNKAIRDLVSEGKLIRKPRLGTFVCEPDEKAQSPCLISTTSRKRSKTEAKRILAKLSNTIALRLMKAPPHG